MTDNVRHKVAKNITLIGATVNVLLAMIKVFFGWLGNSHALFADGLHSLADLLSDGLVVIASRYGNQAADHNHPYGHQRIETAATVAVALLLLLTGAGIIIDASLRLYHHTINSPELIVLWIAAGSIVANEILFHYTRHVAYKIQSPLLEAQAWHRRSDAASSLIVLIGVTATLLGYIYLDAIAAIVVGLLIIKMSIELGWRSISELVDTSIDEGSLKTIRAIIMQTPGVRMIHQLRTRLMGSNIIVDVHVLVDPYLSVSEGHFISQQLQTRLLQQIPQANDVTVHIDPEDDEIAPISTVNLPTRDTVNAMLRANWRSLPGADQIYWIRLHYLSAKIYVDVVLPLQILTVYDISVSELNELYMGAISSEYFIAQVRLFFTE